jgi:L-malate glycosyltransferase
LGNKRNLLIIPSLFPESEEDNKGIFVRDHICSVSEEYKKTVFYIRLFGKEPGKIIEEETGFTIHRVILFRKSKFTVFFKKLLYLYWFFKAALYLRQFKIIDLVHVHGGLFITGILGLFASVSMKVPVVYTEHMGGFYDAYKNPVTRVFAQFIFNRFDIVLLVSNYLLKNVELRGFTPRKSFVIYNPVDTELFLPANNRNNYKLIYVGRFDHNKGAIRVLEAFKEAWNINKQLQLIMIGEGTEYYKAERFISDNPEIKSFISLKGFQNKLSIKTYLQTSAILISPSIVESFGIAVAEAMSCGIPVIIGKGTGPAEFVDERSGIAVDPLSIHEIADAIQKIMSNYTVYNTDYIRRKITDNFSFEVFGTRLSNIYNHLLNPINY